MSIKKTKTSKKSSKNSVKERHVLVGNASYGLYIGLTSDTDAQIGQSGCVTLRDARHVARWYGKTGGITSLAAHGPCGPKAQESRVGAPAPEMLARQVVNVFTLSSEAIAAFDAIKPS